VSPRISIRLLAVQPDERLVRLVREGHERAFEALVHRYRRPLQRYCRSLGLSESRAEDVLQLTLLSAWQALAGGAPVRELRPWLYRIAHNTAVNAARGTSERNTELVAVVSTGGGGAEEELDRRIAMRQALADVAALPPMQRQAILLSAIEGRSHDEVAGALGVNQDAVRGLLYRARASLRSAAALIPQPLISWVYGGAGAAAGSSERVAELSAAGGGGAIMVTGVLVKGAAVAVTAGALLGAAALGPLRAQHAHAGAAARAVARHATDRRSVAAAQTQSGQPASHTETPKQSGHTRLDAGASTGRAHHDEQARGEDGARSASDAASAPARGVAMLETEGHRLAAPERSKQTAQAREEGAALHREGAEGGAGSDAGRGGTPEAQQSPRASTSPLDGAGGSGASGPSPEAAAGGTPEAPPSGEKQAPPPQTEG
jgi:RNA polymerase sigma factor (sigma-70 family)